ncbi:40S ribosomal protein [Ranunculus cassubicifolius]
MYSSAWGFGASHEWNSCDEACTFVTFPDQSTKTTHTNTDSELQLRQWYLQHYGVDIGRMKKTAAALKKDAEEGEVAPAAEETKKSKHVLRKIEKRQEDRKLDAHIEEQFGGGRLLACISSRPGQCGRADGYILL